MLAFVLAGTVVLGACGDGDDGGDAPASPDTSGIPAEVADLADDLQEATAGLPPEQAAEVAQKIQQALQAVIQEAVARRDDPLTDEEITALFRAKMAEAGVPLPGGG